MSEYNRCSNYSCGVVQIQSRPVIQLISAPSGLTACVSPRDGGELSSLSLLDGSKKHELFYNANNWQPVTGWPGKAPWLWPIAGRAYAVSDDSPSNHNSSSSLGCNWDADKKIRPITHHGFARLRQWELRSLEADFDTAISRVSLDSSNDDRESYPFDYRLDSETELSGDSIKLTLRVSAGPRNTSAMPFTTGNHFTWELSSWWGADWLRGTIHGFDGHLWLVEKNGLISDRTECTDKVMHMSDERLANAVIPASADRTIRLISPDGHRQICLSMELSWLPSAEAAIWVTHCDPRQRFFCVEPWIGWPNGINTGQGCVELEPDEEWEFKVSARFIEV